MSETVFLTHLLATEKTPYWMFFDEKPSLKHLRVFGCLAYVLRLSKGSKFDTNAIEGVYLETLEHGVFRILVADDDDFPKLFELRHVTFDKS